MNDTKGLVLREKQDEGATLVVASSAIDCGALVDDLAELAAFLYFTDRLKSETVVSSQCSEHSVAIRTCPHQATVSSSAS